MHNSYTDPHRSVRVGQNDAPPSKEDLPRIGLVES